MGGRRRLRDGAPRLLGDHRGREGRLYRRSFTALQDELGPFRSELLRMEAGRCALAWVNFEVASNALTAARRAREEGRGRRPSAREIERLARRQGLADATYSQALGRLRDLASREVSGPEALLARLKAR